MIQHLIDTHFHLDYYKEHQKIYDGINERKQYTLCMTNSPGVYISCKRIYPETKYLKFALGFHPQDVSLKDADFYDFMQLVNTTNYVGEIGLDFSRQSYISRNKQCMYFEQIVRVCAEKDKLMSVHLRRAEEEAISILKKYRPRRCIIHWFNGNGEQLQQLVDIGCYFSLNSNMVTNEKNKEKLYLIPKTRVLTIFVFLLTGMMLFSQILFIIFAMFLPISFLLSMIPSYESMAKQAIVRVFNTIMTRAGITLIVTVAFSISSMFYNISTDYPFFMVAFLQIVCFAGIYMKLGDLMNMFSLNANDSQSMGRRIFRRPYLFMRHRARRMEHRIARAVSAGGISGGVAGAVAGSAVAGKRAERKNTASKENRGNITSSMGQRAGSKVGAVLDTKNKVKDKANAVKENIKDMPTQTAYAVYSAKEKAKSSVSDFKRGMVQEQQSRQTGQLEKQEQRRQNIADKRMELQKAQEARQAQRKADGSATTGATRPHERPATASTIPKPSAEKMQEVKRPATATTSKASEPVKTNVIKERPLSSGASDRKATQPAQPVHRQNVEKVVSQETHQNDTKDRRIKVQQTQTVQKNQQTIEKTRNLVTKKGQKKK